MDDIIVDDIILGPPVNVPSAAHMAQALLVVLIPVGYMAS